MEPLVSVIMPTLNTEKQFLEDSIYSILNQSYKNFEFIIIIDGGKDNEIVSKFEDNRIKIIIHTEPIGITKSLNEGINISKGKYIARMDSDDIAMKDRLMTEVNFLEKNEEIDIVGMFYKEIGNSHKGRYEVFYKADELKCRLLFANVISHPSIMMRKKFLDQNNLKYDEYYFYAQDFELWTRCSKIGKIEIIPKVGIKYRIHNSQISTEKIQKQSEFYYLALKRNLKELGIDKDNLQYLLMLNGRRKISSKKELKNFINKLLETNKKEKIYDQSKLKSILKTHYCIACIRNKKCFTINFLFIKYIIKRIKMSLLYMAM